MGLRYWGFEQPGPIRCTRCLKYIVFSSQSCIIVIIIIIIIIIVIVIVIVSVIVIIIVIVITIIVITMVIISLHGSILNKGFSFSNLYNTLK